MYFLIGVILLIVFIVGFGFYLHIRIRRLLDKAGYVGKNLENIIEDARLEDQEVPKSLASMDRVYLAQIKKDFIDININQLKRNAEKVILDCYHAIERKDSSELRGKIKSFVDSMIRDYQGKEVRFKHFKFHNTVVSKYQKENGIATIYFASSFEYILDVDGESNKVQDRARAEYIYVIDEGKISRDIHVLGIHCPNCGSPITTLGEKRCNYCGSAVLEIVNRVFVCNDVVRY